MPSPKRPSPMLAKRHRHGAGTSKEPADRGGKNLSVNQDDCSYRLRSAVETERLGEMIGRMLEGGEILALHGDLGVGKTTLVRGVATGLDVPPRAVTSPTFALIHEYTGRLPLAHADLYRLGGVAELAHLGLSEYFDGRTVVAIEWADKAGGYLPDDRLDLSLSYDGARARRALLRATGEHACCLLGRLKRSAGRKRALERAR